MNLGTYEGCIVALLGLGGEAASLREIPRRFLSEPLCALAFASECSRTELGDVPLRYRTPAVCLAAARNRDRNASVEEFVAEVPEIDERIADELFSQDPSVLPFLPPAFRSDDRIIACVTKTHDALPFRLMPCWTDVDFCRRMVMAWPKAVLECHPFSREDMAGLWKLAVERDCGLLTELGLAEFPERTYRSICEAALKKHGRTMRHVPIAMIEAWGEDFLKEAVSHDTAAYSYLPEKLKLKYPALAELAVDKCHHMKEYSWVPEELRTRELAELAVRRAPVQIADVAEPDEALRRLALEEAGSAMPCIRENSGMKPASSP